MFNSQISLWKLHRVRNTVFWRKKEFLNSYSRRLTKQFSMEKITQGLLVLSKNISNLWLGTLPFRWDHPVPATFVLSYTIFANLFLERLRNEAQGARRRVSTKERTKSEWFVQIRRSRLARSRTEKCKVTLARGHSNQNYPMKLSMLFYSYFSLKYDRNLKL